jgi:Bacterial PH domain
MMPLARVTDMRYQRSPLGRILGYGTFVLESAGQDQALSSINFLPDPDELYREVCELLFNRPT